MTFKWTVLLFTLGVGFFPTVTFANSCLLLLQKTYEIEDDFNTYAFGPLIEGRRRVHIIKHGPDVFNLNSKEWLKHVKTLVLARENFNTPHVSEVKIDENFVVTAPFEPKLSKSEFAGPDGKKLKSLFMRSYRRQFRENKHYKLLPDFEYEKTGGVKLLFMVEMRSGNETIELVFTSKAPMKTHMSRAVQYGFYIMDKLSLPARVTDVRIYGGGFD